MISNDNFAIAMTMLQGISPETKLNNLPPLEFGEEYAGQSPILTAVKILNQAATNGSQEQRQELTQSQHKIEALNQSLAEIEPSSDPLGLAGLQVKLPQTKFQRMLEIATVIPRIAFTILLDILLLPGALLLIIAAKCKADFNPHPDNVKKDKIPILLLHGSGFNESEWIVGRQFMKKEEYGSVFSMNYDGLVSNDPTKGIEDYARDKITAEINRIKALTGQDEVILVGHSMGGLIAG